MQKSLEALASTFALLVDKVRARLATRAARVLTTPQPFVVGDRIMLATGDKGVVEHIGIRTTHIRALGEGELLIGGSKPARGGRGLTTWRGAVPNVELANTRIRNRSRCDHRRVECLIEIDSGTNPAKLALVKTALERAVRDTPSVLRLEGVGFAGIGGHFGGFVYELVYHCVNGETSTMRLARHTVLLNSVQNLAELGVKFARPMGGPSPSSWQAPAAAADSDCPGMADVTMNSSVMSSL
jgi:hypothetical protein